MEHRQFRKTQSHVPVRPQSQKSHSRTSGMTHDENLLEKINGIFDGQSQNSSFSKKSQSKGNYGAFAFETNGNDLDGEDLYETMMQQQQQPPSHALRPPKLKSATLDGNDALARAKNLIREKKEVIQKAQIKQQYQIATMKEDTFMTGVGLVHEPVEVQKDSSDEEPAYPDFDEEEYVRNLIRESKNDTDDLEELRRMIKSTKKSIEDYAEDLYTLKSSVSEANIGFREIGKGVNEAVFMDMDHQLMQFMPDFDKHKIFSKDSNQVSLPKLNVKRPVLATISDADKKKSATALISKQSLTTTNKTKNSLQLKKGDRLSNEI